MAQITQDFVSYSRTLHKRGEHMKTTINEEEQLLHAWEELQHRRNLDKILDIGSGYDLMQITTDAGLGRYWGGHGDHWEWNYSAVRNFGRAEAVELLLRYEAAKPGVTK